MTGGVPDVENPILDGCGWHMIQGALRRWSSAQGQLRRWVGSAGSVISSIPDEIVLRVWDRHDGCGAVLRVRVPQLVAARPVVASCAS